MEWCTWAKVRRRVGLGPASPSVVSCWIAFKALGLGRPFYRGSASGEGADLASNPGAAVLESVAHLLRGDAAVGALCRAV